MAVGGIPPSTRQRLLGRSREELAPHASLAAVAASAERVVGAVSVAATIVSGLGLLTALQVSTAGWVWALPSVVLAALSLTFAVWATVPALDDVRPGDLEDIDRFFTDQIKIRGRLVRASAITLGIAMLLTPLPALAVAFDGDDRELTLGSTREGEAFRVRLWARGFSDDTELAVLAHGRSREVVVLRAGTRSDGTAELRAIVPSTFLAGAVSLRATAKTGSEIVRRQVSLVP